MPGLDNLFDLLELAIKARMQLALENIALRQQLAAQLAPRDGGDVRPRFHPSSWSFARMRP